MKPDFSDTLATAQAKAAERPAAHAHVMISAMECPVCNPGDPRAVGVPVDLRTLGPIEGRRCLFGHSVPANQGYQVKAGWVCYSHADSFDTAGA